MDRKTLLLPCGIPTIDLVQQTVCSYLFRQMYRFSEEYLGKNIVYLANYPWIRDALNQWSRIYEYPFCYEKLKNLLSPSSRLLDAGSGITFFPFFLARDYEVTCLDKDDYTDVYQKINASQEAWVLFVQAEIHQIPAETESMDAVFCISVLEHTEEFDRIIREFHRVLKPNGVLIVTFDVSLDHNREGIEPAEAIHLLEYVGSLFTCEYGADEFQRDLQQDGLYTTSFVNQWCPELLPWRPASLSYRLKNFLRKSERTMHFRNQIQMTFCNIVAIK